MAAQPQQEEGWPLGLQPLNVRAGIVRNRDLNGGSLSFNTLLSVDSPVSSSDSSTDLDSESTGSFFHDRSITLGSLIGISNILELSRRSTRGRVTESSRRKNFKSKTWFLSLCSRISTDAVTINNTPSLGHFLEAERKAAINFRRNPGPHDDFALDDFSHVLDPNSLFIEGQVAPPLSSEIERTFGRDLLAHENADAAPMLLSCLCGN